MSPDEQISMVEEFMSLINRGDIEGALAYVHEDWKIVEQPGMPYSGEWRGHDGFRALFAAIGSTWSRWKDAPHPYELASVGNRVIKEVHFTATLRATGEVIEMDFVEVMEFRDGKIALVRPYYWDPERIARAAIPA